MLQNSPSFPYSLFFFLQKILKLNAAHFDSGVVTNLNYLDPNICCHPPAKAYMTQTCYVNVFKLYS